MWWLAWRHLVHHRVQSAILAACVGLVVFLPLTATALVGEYDSRLRSRAAATPLVVGPKGSALELTLGALYFRRADDGAGERTIPFGQVAALTADGRAVGIPLNLRFTARGWPVVATSLEYYELRQLQPAVGTVPLRLGEVTVGADVAAQLGLGVGDVLYTDTADVYDLGQPPALEVAVVGVLPPTATADDGAVFTDIKTAWILEGRAHGHGDVRAMGAADIDGRAGDVTAVAPGAVEYYRVTEDNLHTFHTHGDEGAFPLTGILLIPDNARDRTILKARINGGGEWQALEPRLVVGGLMEQVLRIKVLFDAVALGLGLAVAALLGLQVALSVRLRAGEVRTLRRMGCSRGTVPLLHGAELVMVFGAGVGLAVLGSRVALWALPDLVRGW